MNSREDDDGVVQFADALDRLERGPALAAGAIVEHDEAARAAQQPELEAGYLQVARDRDEGDDDD